MTLRSLLIVLGLIGTFVKSSYGQPSRTDFVSTWVTDRTDLRISNDSSIIIFVNPNLQYNYDVDWDNDGVFEDSSITDSIFHQYPRVDTFTIRIRGEFPHILFGGQPANSPKLLAIEQWGDFYWKSLEESFSFTDMIVNDSLPPRLDSVNSCVGTFRKSTVNMNVSNWDVSGIVDMSRMFQSAKGFNQDISGWDVSSVQSMEEMFMDAESFNQPLNSWDVSNVTNIAGIFTYAGVFDQPLDQWDVSNVTIMKEAFFQANSFDQDMASWDVSNVVDMSGMFTGTLINCDLNSWDVTSVTDMRRMFQTPTFNGRIDQWDVSNVQNMRLMFADAASFDQDISNWDVSQVTDMSYMFEGAQQFNQDISSWKVDSVQSFSYMFQDAVNFNQDIGAWNVGKSTNFSFMFNRATNFDQDLSGWDLSSAIDMRKMFTMASSFDQDLSDWDISNINNMLQMLDSCGLSLANYDSTLIGWSTQNIRAGVELGAKNLIYCKGDSARLSLINRGWAIVGDSLDCPVGLFEPDFDQEQMIHIWPNPANETLYIDLNSKLNTLYSVFDSQGKLVLEGILRQKHAQIDLIPLQTGLYILRIGNRSKRFLIE